MMLWGQGPGWDLGPCLPAHFLAPAPRDAQKGATPPPKGAGEGQAVRISSFWDMVEREKGWFPPPSDMPCDAPRPSPSAGASPYKFPSWGGSLLCAPSLAPPGLVFPLPGGGGMHPTPPVPLACSAVGVRPGQAAAGKRRGSCGVCFRNGVNLIGGVPTSLQGGASSFQYV